MTTPGGAYSAGTIFLQVIPSYRDFMRTVGRDAKEIEKALGQEIAKGDAIGKAVAKNVKSSGARKAIKEAAGEVGEEAADEYAGRFRQTLERSLKKASRELKALKPDLDTEQVEEKIRRVEKQLERLAKLEIGVDVTSGEMVAELTRLEAVLAAIRDQSVDIEVKSNIGSTLRDIETVRKDVESLSGTKHDIELTVDNKDVEKVERRLGAFGRDFRNVMQGVADKLGDITALTASGRADISELVSRAERLASVDVGVDLSAEEALAEAAMLQARLELLESDPVEIEARFNSGKASADLAAFRARVVGSDSTLKVKADASQTISFGNAARQASENLRAFNGMILLGASVGPLLVPVLASLAAGALAAGTAFVGAGIGLGALILGFSGISDAVKAINDVEQNAAKDARASAKATRAAANSVRDAERSLSVARLNAARAAEDASERVASALEGQRRAEENLREAQRDAVRAQERLTQARASAQDQLEDMALRARGGALAERQALIDLFEAEVAYRNAMADGGATNLEREQAAINLERERLNIEQVRIENGRLAEEQAQVASTGVEGTDAVVQAREALLQANNSVADAERAVARSQQEVARARVDQARSAVDSARAIEDAQLRLADAQLAYSDAVGQTLTSVDKLNQEMSKLGPAGQAFAVFIAGLKDEFFGLRNSVQEGMLPGVTAALQNLLPFMPQINSFFGTMGKVIGDLFLRFSQFLTTSPAMLSFFKTMERLAPVFTTLFAEIGMVLLEVFAELAVAFAPFARDMLTGLRDILIAFRDFLQSQEGQQMLADFMDYVREAGPQMLDLLGSLALALINLGVALAPYAGQLAEALISVLDFIAGMDPDLLGKIVVGILLMVTAFQAMSGLVGGLGAVATLVAFLGRILAPLLIGSAGAALGWAAAIAAVVAILVIAYFKFEWFRDFVNMVVNAIWEFLKWRVEMMINVFKGLMWWLRFVADVWTSVFDLIWKMIQKYFSLMSDGIDAFMETGAGKALASAMDWVAEKWGQALEVLRSLWDDLLDIGKGVVTFIVDTVINDGFVDNFNKVADFFGSKPISRLELPSSFYTRSDASARTDANRDAAMASRTRMATGGVVPGFSASPTSDNIPAMLTAGEYVLPVRAVQALRGKFGDQFLEMLRQGLPGFAKGGLVEFGRLLQARGFRVSEHPAFGGVRGRHTTNSWHYRNGAIDVNYGPGGTSLIEQRAIDQIVGLAGEYGLRSIWRTSGHFDHAHFDVGGGKSLLGTAWDGVKGVGRVLKDAAGNVIDAPLDWLRSTVRGLYGKATESPLGRVLVNGVEHMIGMAAHKAGEIGGSIGDFFTNDDDKPNLYDSGGWLPPGLTAVMNATGRPEAVLTADQWAMLEAGIGQGGGGDTINIPVTQQNSPEAVADAVLFATRRQRRGGVYAGRA